MDKLDDARGVITGPMWAREETARENDAAVQDMAHMGRWGLWACVLVVAAYALAAWLDESVSYPPAAGGCTLIVEGR